MYKCLNLKKVLLTDHHTLKVKDYIIAVTNLLQRISNSIMNFTSHSN